MVLYCWSESISMEYDMISPKNQYESTGQCDASFSLGKWHSQHKKTVIWWHDYLP